MKKIILLLIISFLIQVVCNTETATSQNYPSGTSNNTVTEVRKTKAGRSTEKTELFLAAAASLTDVTTEIIRLYKSVKPNVNIICTFSSSGTLQTQIEEGAPADIFISASKKQVTTLEEKGLVKEGTKKELLINKVVLITPADNEKNITSFEELSTDKISTIALGEPSSVPVGQYSEEIFSYLRILDKVKPKANYGSDVRQVLTWVENGDVDCGVVYATDAALADKVKVVCEAPVNSHKPVIYPAVVLKSSKHSGEAEEFLSYLSTPEIENIFKKYGFEVE
ncbi:molybdate ABC transporter substrate-binding protein [Ruminiclostridium herbifermentans]|uniref:Molybdate ABC transporter substrate-binding protein n=1 Tax=Ruminiclostridium herbifermentans TaxID=2488810 RepID=A0A4V6EP26_9FIRM|nr:molybdate ABC transporter substrate-binding protein [Ruminiclostridium herbifermentans]